MSTLEFTSVTQIAAAPERVWAALTEPEDIRRYWFGVAMQSDWQVGSPVKWQNSPEEEFQDLGQVVLAAEPYHRLSYSWHLLQPTHAQLFGWSEAELAEYSKEPRTKVVFDIAAEPDGSLVTVVHSGFAPDSMMYRAISGQLTGSGGWGGLMKNLKILLETGRVHAVRPDQA
ncbi:transcriptional regulator [Nocardia panacis]|uniref:Transcriptional regulator n=1 Tax=Nocardia panacis TaxID=2340916 RepID=A0A3A4K5U0_9NOCA|nr:SRPBCC domain-containing protein [Nocardia panacis]RJO72510.1 transcriptional regulator [Nocardia panacis]